MEQTTMHTDYEPAVHKRDGEWRDLYIEDVLGLIYEELYHAEHFDDIFTGIVRHYINPDCPYLKASIAGKDKAGLGVLNYPIMLCFDFEVISRVNASWEGGFDYMPDATVAVSIRHNDGVHSTDYAPGKNVTQATLAAMMQLAREIAFDTYNQPELELQEQPKTTH